MNFRERPQHNYVPAFPDESKGVGRIIEKFKICLVENDNDFIRDQRHKVIDCAL